MLLIVEVISKNANYHKGIIQDAIIVAKNKYNCEVKAIVTDNIKDMEKTRGNKLKFPCMWMFITYENSPNTIIMGVVKVQKFFRSHHIPTGLLRKEHDSVKP